MPEPLETQINSLLHERFEIPLANLKPEALLIGGLGLDSLDAADLIVMLEEMTNKKVNPSDFMRHDLTLGHVYEIVARVSAKES